MHSSTDVTTGDRRLTRWFVLALALALLVAMTVGNGTPDAPEIGAGGIVAEHDHSDGDGEGDSVPVTIDDEPSGSETDDHGHGGEGEPDIVTPPTDVTTAPNATPQVADATTAATRTAFRVEQPRNAVPEDRYAMSRGCYVATSVLTGNTITRDGGGFAATGDADTAEPFFFQATELGIYLVYGTAEDFLATNGAAVVSRSAPDTDTEWIVDATTTAGVFRFTNLASGDRLVADDAGVLSVADRADGPAAHVRLDLAEGCTAYPEIEVNIDGDAMGGESAIADTLGYAEAHTHVMAFQFLGGMVHCGRPWHRYGVTHALVDCPDHEGNGVGAALENFFSTGSPAGTHDPVGWPTFNDWPAPRSLTHEQTYYKWMERAWRGGLRVMVGLTVENDSLCRLYPLNRNSCDEMESVRLQLKNFRELENYIDAQWGGPGEGWFRIVEDPFEARRVINDGKMALVLGIEVSTLFGCGFDEVTGAETCTTEDIDAQLAEMYDAGVRQMELVNKFDSALSGVAGDGGATGLVVNQGNLLATGRYWDFRTCPEDFAPGVEDKRQPNLGDDAGFGSEPDPLFAAIADLFAPRTATPAYPSGPHCNVYGLGEKGAYLADQMAERGMLIDPDHMSVRGRMELLDHLDAAGYQGVMSSHGWSTPDAYAQILEMGGFIGSRSGSTSGYVKQWQDARSWADDRYFFGLGYGADNNGLGGQPSAVTLEEGQEGVVYPFEGFGGVTVNQQVSGTKTYDVNEHGVAHYGLYVDWFHLLGKLVGDQIVEDMQNGAEAYLLTWERALGITSDACMDESLLLSRSDFAQKLSKGMTAEDVLFAVGQPNRRTGDAFSYCIAANGNSPGGVTVRFDANGRVTQVA